MSQRRSYSPVSVDGDENEYSISHPTKDTKCLKEKTVFRSISESSNEDDYPIFTLRNVVVYKQDGTTYGNLLNAELEGPFLVRGALDISDNDKDLFAFRRSPLLQSDEV